MPTLDSSKDRALPKLRSYLSAILNIKEKELEFLPCYAGYLVFVNKKNSMCIWIHRSTIEGILKVGYNLLVDTGSDLIFNLIWGGSILRELLKGIIPDPPKETLVFYPGLHRINYGTIIPEEGASGIVVKGISKASTLINKTGKTFLNMLPKGDQKDETNIKDFKEAIEKKSYTYIKFQDFLYTTLAKESLKGSLPGGLNSGFEFRTIFNEL